MRWWQKVANLFRGKKKKHMLKNRRAKPETAQEGRGNVSEVSEDVPKKEVKWYGYEAEEELSLQHSSDSTEPEDEVFEEESPANYSPPPDCHSGKSDQVSSSNVYTSSDPAQGPTVSPQVPSIVIEDSNHPVDSRECRPQRRATGAPAVPASFLRMNENAAVTAPNGHNEMLNSTGYDACSDSLDEDQIIRKMRCRGRRKNSSHIKVKYTKVYGESDGAYRNDSTPRGLVFMCNFSKFKNTQYGERIGSGIDYENMVNLFQQMGYDVSHRKGRFCQTGYITKKDFMERLKAFSQDAKHTGLCSCVIIIMSHGSGPKTFITSDDKEVDLMEVYSIFDNIHCEYLRGKPKLFILQFCRNNPSDVLGGQSKGRSESLPVDDDLLRIIVREEVRRALQRKEQEQRQQCDGEDTNGDISAQSPLFLAIEQRSRNASVASLSSLIEPNTSQVADETDSRSYCSDTRNVVMLPQEGVQRYSDMYSIFSTSSGELSHRDPHKGSLLIQAICHVFAECAYQDEIDTLVRKVSMYMTKTLQKDDPITVPRQTCERTNNGLDKYFYFNPKEVHYPRHVTI